jgi:DNA-binding helix-hairpin-helix protein with protein kinase domain
LVRLVDESGQPVRLGDKLGEGGEGKVYRLSDRSSLAIKVYSSPLSAEKVHKIRVLTQLAMPEIVKFTAWPSGLALDTNGRPRGLLLPVVERGHDIHHLYTPSSRRRYFPDANWRFLVHVAANVARAFGAVHQLGLVIGDVNPGSILVLPDGTVRLIDVDSFQVPVSGRSPLLCTVAVPLFLPPELQGTSLDSVVRTPHHDAFGLAITIFQLLMLGRHPYAGRFLGSGDMSIEKAIAEHRFAFGSRAAARDMERPPNTVGLEMLPAGVATLFEAAFAPTAGEHGRPSAVEWVSALTTLTVKLGECGLAPSHHYPRSLPHCPWCPIERDTGVLLFGGRGKKTALQGHEAGYQRLLSLIEAIPKPAPLTPSAVNLNVHPNPAAEMASKTPVSSWVSCLVGLLLIVGGVALFHGGNRLLPLVLGTIALATGATARRRRQAPWVNAFRNAKDEYEQATRQLSEANRFPAHTAAQTAVALACRSWDDLPRRRTKEYQQLEANKRELQWREFLEAQLIESASIKGIGRGRVAMLSSYGIDTAWDIEGRRIKGVPNFGPVLAERLVNWRRSRERAFIYHPSRPLPKEAIARLERETDEERRRIIERLRRALRDLQAANTAEPPAVARAAERVRTADSSLRQAEADVRAATGSVPV